MTESSLIRAVRQRAAGGPGVRVGIGDDCAVLEPASGTLLLATTDLLLEDVHFRRRYAEPADIGWKSVAVNLSDIASMGGRPRWALVALACPTGTSLEEAEAFYAGALALAGEHGVALVGGDTSVSPAGWLVNVTVLGEVTLAPVLRSTARLGDVVAVTGTVGRAAAGLAVLDRAKAPPGVPAEWLADVTGAHLRPRPRVAEGQWLASAGGVHLAEESGVGARVEIERLPIAESTRGLARALGDDPLAWATGGGEDYELLLTSEPNAFSRLGEGLERATGARLSRIGEIVADGAVHFVDARGRERPATPGFEHFAAERRRG
ncbi:MAG: thiamine-phosphate kinase [Candidatus Rokubacteria bacterium 13_1_40CM_4_69_5]|nr:MAG: thiamine-phosphate kinase [Candidatus Rokubacteria bacterium 13_1_40CM_4_69_5]